MTTLVVTAHPDDEVLGCGGMIARLAAEGHEVYVAILGEGITSRTWRRGEADASDVARLREHTQMVGRALGARKVFTYELPDNRFDTVPLLNVVKIVENLVEQLKPQTLYTHCGGDLNVDHGVVHRAVLTATRPMSGCPVERIYAFEVPSSTEWAFGQFTPRFSPNSFVDIAATLDKKIEAMEIYESERREFPHPRSPEALRAVARRWGSVVGREAVEAFELIRAIT